MERSSPDDCPGPEELARWAVGGGLSPRDEAHLSRCPACTGRLAEALRPEEPGAEGLQADPKQIVAALGIVRPARFARRFAAAAAAATLVAGGVFVFLQAPRFHGSGQDVKGRPLADGETVVSTPRGRTDSIVLADGSHLKLGSAATVELAVPRPGERVRLRLTRGSVQVETEKEVRAFVVEAAAGEIRVVGTRFTARTFNLYGPPGTPKRPARISVLAVEVSEGEVFLSGQTESTPVRAGRRGILRAGLAPFLQEAAPQHWTELAARWGKNCEAEEFADSFACLNLLSGSWKGLSSWEDVLDDPSAEPRHRRLAAALVAARAEPEERERLDQRIQREPDATVRRLLQAALERMEE